MSRPASVGVCGGGAGAQCAHSAQRGVAPGDTLCGDSRQNTPQAQHDTRRAHSGPGPADGRLRRSGTGLVHAWVGQILLNCDVFKR